jgi:amino acid permease
MFQDSAIDSNTPPDGNGGILWSQAAASVNGNGGTSVAAVSGGFEDGHPIQFLHDDETSGTIHNVNGDGDNVDDDSDNVRIGTISSARFNVLSTMVGGGCLSLPLAFQKSGNALVGPIMLLVTALMTDFCFRLLVASANHVHPTHPTRPGKNTFESITSVAFGNKAYIFSMTLVVLMCFFGAVGYSVLLRDMMEPINDVIAKHISGSAWLHKNFTMFLVILLVTPFCTLRHLTALKDCGAASMTSILILGSCVVFRSIQCNVNGPHTPNLGGGSGIDVSALGGAPWYTYLTFFPESWRDLLDAVPLYISCFVCHYNILPVHNELKEPTSVRVSWWLRSTTWFALALYMIMGFAGSSYAHCTPTGKVQGNILLDFDENDPLLMVGRMCLAVTITLAFPMLIIPARDILLRSLIFPALMKRANRRMENDATNVTADATTERQLVGEGSTGTSDLQEPLLSEEDPPLHPPTMVGPTTSGTTVASSGHNNTIASASFGLLLSTSIVIFWTAAVLASCVSSIDVVWDLLGSSLSILLSYLIPASTYLVITKQSLYTNNDSYYNDDFDGRRQSLYTRQQFWSRIVCWLLLLFFSPLMVVSTINAVINTFG